ncbi:MAG TPA: manganese efflux pump [Dehalococcoidia bacterium]|nr:manganese efflux pump [Dehalococcoidia bacterium]
MTDLDIISIIFIALGLSADCFAVALSGSVSMKSFTRFQVFRTAFTFGLFQSLMPVLGWLLGQTVVDFIADYDHWIAFILLGFVGGKMIRESFQKKEEKQSLDITRGFLLFTLGVATSIDALAVGLTFAFIKVNITLAVVTIGITAFLATVVSFLIGKKLNKLAGRWAELIGGLILLAIGIRIVVTHLLS